LILLIWFGIRLRGVRMRDLIGGRWATVEAFLLDAALAFGFWIVALLLLFGLRVALAQSISTICRNQWMTLCAFLVQWLPTLILRPDSLCY